MTQRVIFSPYPETELDKVLRDMAPAGVFVLCDSNTAGLAYPRVAEKCVSARNAHLIVTPCGDENKTIDSLSAIWRELQLNGATRHSVLVNLGGGMVTDMGAFAAATFKRGMRWVNVPTTLLGCVDAALGGKTGINFNGFKNEIGVFADADAVIISTAFLSTLPKKELLSGYAEMLKHGLLKSESEIMLLLDVDIDSVLPMRLMLLLERSISVKTAIVASDPLESGLRKVLNLGHTFGHAFESWSLGRHKPVPHGYAVAWGIVCSLVMSHMKFGFDAALLRRVAAFVEREYGRIDIACADYPALIELMRHDKKNVTARELCFTLLESPGVAKTGVPAAEEDVCVVFDLFRDLLHI